ncbi:thiolase-like protein, partial [Cenococcum geophilum]
MPRRFSSSSAKKRSGLKTSTSASKSACERKMAETTPIGDPIEAKSLAQTFGKSRALGDAVHVGSIKPNIGHTGPVSGLASIIKTALVLQKQLIPPHINYEKPNPAILLGARICMPLRASVNNFGYRGTNVCIIMEALSGATATNGTSYINGING